MPGSFACLVLQFDYFFFDAFLAAFLVDFFFAAFLVAFLADFFADFFFAAFFTGPPFSQAPSWLRLSLQALSLRVLSLPLPSKKVRSLETLSEMRACHSRHHRGRYPPKSPER
jgi:hypothetical protein